MISDFTVMVARGKARGVRRFYKFGRNADIDTAAREDIISSGGTWAAPATASRVGVASTSTSDTANGTGLQTLTITGLDADYAEVTETITLNGTSTVNSVNSYWIVFRMIGNTAGSTGANVGTVTCTSQAANTPVQAQILPGDNQSQFIVYQVPAGKTLFLYDWAIGNASTGFCEAALQTKPFGGVFNVRGNMVVAGNGDTSQMYDFHIPLRIQEKSLVKISATVSANNQNVYASMEGIEIDNDQHILGYDDTVGD